ncbi:MAG: sulfatase [Planctomycetaceae bacterium]|nr:sulfatase [Planctomycetaceae bacterium]
MRRHLSRVVLVTATILAGVSSAWSGDVDAPKTSRPNVLFIAIDDLRPQLGCYGHEYMYTPRLDRLASQGRLFHRHYVQVPTCGASRCALLTGRYPRTPADISNMAVRSRMAGREESPDPESFAHLFRRSGYHTVCLGKISHYVDGRIYNYDKSGDGSLEMPHSWDDVGLPYGKWKDGWSSFFGYADGSGRTRGVSPPIESADVDDEGYPDGLIANAAIEKLRSLRDQQFLLCVGFFKPHLPFCAPQKYFDLYDPLALPLSPNPDPPVDVDPRSLHRSSELFGNYGREVDDPFTDIEYHRRLRHAYFACVSYVDTQVGKVLDELDRLGLMENTIVVVWGDHGWHLGDQSIWGKHTTFERALRSTLIVRTPHMSSPGTSTSAIVETVDLYPTLTDLCGIDPPAGLDGQSLVPVLNDPDRSVGSIAFGFWENGSRTLRTDRYRLVHLPADGTAPEAFELYDHDVDPLETRNIAAAHPDVVAELATRLAPLDKGQIEE